jgi:hypothetical protein
VKWMHLSTAVGGGSVACVVVSLLGTLLGGVLAVGAANYDADLPASQWPVFPMAGGGEAFRPNGPANGNKLVNPLGLAAMPDGGVLIADSTRVLRVGRDGLLTVVAGTGRAGFSGDGGPATRAKIDGASDVAIAADGSVLIADTGNVRIRRIDSTGTIATVAGTEEFGFGSAGDGGPATSATLEAPVSVAATADGGFLIADLYGDRIRRVAANGVITRAAGRGGELPVATPGDRAGAAGSGGSYGGDGGPAVRARLSDPVDVAATADGGFLIADQFYGVVRRVDPQGVISTVAGRRTAYGYRSTGDGGLAIRAGIPLPLNVEPTPDGGFLIATGADGRIRAVSADGRISTLAGEARPGLFGGNGERASATAFPELRKVARAPDGRLLILEWRRLRVLSPAPSAVLAVAIGPGTRATRNGVTVRFVSTTDAAVELALGSATVEASAHSGANTLVLPTSLVPGRAYTVRLTAVSTDGQRATDRARLIAGGLMTRRRAQRLADAYVRDLNRRFADPTTFWETRRCRRASRSRIDCRMLFFDVDDTYCAGYVAVAIERDGQVYLARRRGCRFKPHARLSNPSPATLY